MKFAECFSLSDEEIVKIKEKIYIQKFLSAVSETVKEELPDSTENETHVE